MSLHGSGKDWRMREIKIECKQRVNKPGMICPPQPEGSGARLPRKYLLVSAIPSSSSYTTAR